jgi:hypothetical protein
MAAELCLTGRRLIGLRRSLAGTFEGWRPVAGFRSCNLFTPKKTKKKKWRGEGVLYAVADGSLQVCLPRLPG